MAHLIPWYSVWVIAGGTPWYSARPVNSTPYTLVPCTAGGGWHTLYLGTLYGRWWMAHLITCYSVRPVVVSTPYTLVLCGWWYMAHLIPWYSVRPVDGTPYTLVPCTAGGWHTLYLGTFWLVVHDTLYNLVL